MIRRRIVGTFSVLLDTLLIGIAFFLALSLRFDGHIPGTYFRNFLFAVPWVMLVSVFALYLAGTHRVIWRYAGLRALVDIVRALTAAAFAMGLVFVIWEALTKVRLFPLSVLVLFWILEVFLVAGVRLTGRLEMLRSRHSRRPDRGQLGGVRRVLIFGAGDVGEALARDFMRGGKYDWEPVGFVDDSKEKAGRTIHGLRVLGTTLDIPRLIRAHRIDEVFIAAPTAPSALVSSIFRCCQDEGIGCKTVPSLADYAVGKSPLKQLREVRIEDLLGREQVQIDLEGVSGFLKGRRVLVTGAGGSIGSELCRQIARFTPASLVALDHDENKLCYVALELRSANPELVLKPVVVDVKDRRGLETTIGEERVEIIFHAAAHKHVTFMEENPRAAIMNNVVGTRMLAEVAIAQGVENFVLISTDKAVNPTNVMGASKRLCEKIVTALAGTSGTRFTSVRFGNVLGSEGSVIQIFKRQIAGGGPVTITHPEARRYFMTISEAAKLVIQASAFGEDSTVFVLDMGEQVKVLDVAKQLIRLSGLEPERDIQISVVGLRPGEKLYEELLTSSELTTMSRHHKIFIWRSEREAWDLLAPQLDHLVAFSESCGKEEIKTQLASLVPEYRTDAPVASIDEVPEMEPAVRTRDLEDSFVLPPHFRPVREAWPIAALRGAVRCASALLAMPVVGLLSLLHLACAPGAPVFVRELRVGRNRRVGPRRIFRGAVPIDRRAKDRRKKNLYGRPFACLRFNAVPRPGSSRMERRFCTFLRRRRLDRLPSALHLISGHMGLVGPDPEPLERLEDSFASLGQYRSRFAVRPGFTGLTHVLGSNGSAQEDLGRRAEIDKFYVDHRSLAFDLRILTRRLSVVLAGEDEPLRFRDRLGVNAVVAARFQTAGEEL